ncbi:MAG: LPS assembly lipoprotein LptE [Desulfomonilaceae bacterium]
MRLIGIRTVLKRICIALIALGVGVTGCGYRFAGDPGDTPFPPELKTIVLESAINNTTVRGIETEFTNALRSEFALGTRLKQVASGGDLQMKTQIVSFEDTPSAYRADGKEATRIGTLTVRCSLQKSDTHKELWKKDFSSSQTYDVTDSIAETLSNRRRAISRMIRDLIPRIHRSLYDSF